MSDVLHQNLLPVQSDKQPLPVTIVAAATIAPQSNPTILSGTTAIATITPPVSGAHELIFIHATTNFGGFATTGNIIAASITNSTAWGDKVTRMWYNPINKKYYPSFGTAT